MALLGLLLHLAIAFPFAFGAFAVLGMLQKSPEHGAHFVYGATGVCFLLSLVATSLWYRLRKPSMEDADSAAAFLFAHGLARVWSGQ